MKTILLVSAITVSAQADVTGKWKLNRDKTQFNQTPGANRSDAFIQPPSGLAGLFLISAPWIQRSAAPAMASHRFFCGMPSKKNGRYGFLQRAQQCLALADYTEKELNKAGVKAWRNPHALTVVFPKPGAAVCHKWQLATENDLAHLICMPGVTKAQIDDFIIDMKVSNA